MQVRKGLFLTVVLLAFGAGAWAQGHRGGGGFYHGPTVMRGGARGGGGYHFGRNFVTRPLWGGAATHSAVYPQRSYRSYGFQPGWNYGYTPYGYSSYTYPGYAGYAYPYSLPYYGSPTGCDPRFSAPPYYCQPLYPHGPPDYGPAGEGFETRPMWQGAAHSDPVPAPDGMPRGAPQVQLTFDGHAQAAGSVLAVSSGKHHLVIRPRPVP